MSRATAIDAGAVLAWGVPRIRDLPWRHERDPWKILVAEVMLQQTQVGRVIPKWTAFLSAFPTPAACSEATLGEVLRLWLGLGYPRRARNLHGAAQIIVERHDGMLPTELDELLALPGIGPYTARAILAFAYERDVAVVDTNIARVLARTAGERLTPKRAQDAADAVVPMGQGWVWNQVLMDLGAIVCRPQPLCEHCPLDASCAWNVTGRALPDPATGSAGVSTKQARFEGSKRQQRGRVMAALHTSSQHSAQFDDEILCGLIDDGLIVRVGDHVELPS